MSNVISEDFRIRVPEHDTASLSMQVIKVHWLPASVKLYPHGARKIHRNSIRMDYKADIKIWNALEDLIIDAEDICISNKVRDDGDDDRKPDYHRLAECLLYRAPIYDDDRDAALRVVWPNGRKHFRWYNDENAQVAIDAGFTYGKRQGVFYGLHTTDPSVAREFLKHASGLCRYHLEMPDERPTLF